MQKVIYVDKYLTSAEFYRAILPEIQIVLKYYDKIDEVIFDFSGTYKVEPNVIPNLLCLGRVTQSLLGYKVTIRIPDTFEGGKLKNYLYLIGFVNLAKASFAFEANPYTGFDGKKIDPLCGTVYFDENVKDDKIGFEFDRLVGPFAEKYLKDYNKLCLDNGQVENKVMNLLKELASNATEHGKSYSYTTVHAKYSKRIIFIAISDSGKGFLQSCNDEHRSELADKDIVLHNEIEAIIYCIYMRKSSKIFGLYAVIRDTISAGGTVRIHSNDSQVIFTPRIRERFENKTLLEDAGFWKYNVKRDLEFSGTHIEIEIPF